ncbi:hypothetical protein GCM10010191_25380 [Actinomadura vinacea]|uniref:Uncharacterized protein n=1 Tax=Actinomadura vinacea TaxID=115336 RepID=A0ABN3IU79_9ACTN
MGDTPFEPFFHGPPGRGRRRGSHRLPLQRTFRCRSTLRSHTVASMARYEEFVRLHEAFSARPRVHARRLWLCGAGTAVIVGALMFGGVALVRGPLGIDAPVFAGRGASTQAAALAYAVSTMIASLQATALLHVLLAVAERPLRAFACLGAMAVALLTLLPLTLRIPPAAAWATAALDLAGGIAVVGLLAAVAHACVVWPEPPPERRRKRR